MSRESTAFALAAAGVEAIDAAGKISDNRRARAWEVARQLVEEDYIDKASAQRKQIAYPGGAAAVGIIANIVAGACNEKSPEWIIKVLTGLSETSSPMANGLTTFSTGGITTLDARLEARKAEKSNLDGEHGSIDQRVNTLADSIMAAIRSLRN